MLSVLVCDTRGRFFYIEVRFIHKVVWISNYMYSLKGELICQWQKALKLFNTK